MISEFVASRPSSGPYFERNVAELASHGIPSLDNLYEVPTLPAAQADEVLRSQLELACQAQNISNINFGRYCIQNIPREWILANIERLVAPLLATNKEWEYRRLLELYSTLDADLTISLAIRATEHEDLGVQEAGYDFGG